MGKTTLTALLACVPYLQNMRVLAGDGDPQANLAAILGNTEGLAEYILAHW